MRPGKYGSGSVFDCDSKLTKDVPADTLEKAMAGWDTELRRMICGTVSEE